MQFGVFLGVSLLQEHVVIVDVFESTLEADHFLDELEPVVQGGAVIVVYKQAQGQICRIKYHDCGTYSQRSRPGRV